jgi:plastocyanin
VAVTVAAAALTLIAAGCGSSKSESTATTAAAAATTAAPAATTAAPAAATTTAAAGGGAGATVNATETEFKIALDATTFKPGETTFAITNSGSFKHNITIEGPGVDETKSDTIEPGKTGSVKVTLAAGEYEVYCSIPTHKDKGMDLKITVA